MFTNKSAKSVLIIGATGATGRQICEKLFGHPTKPSIHVLCRSPRKIYGSQSNYASITEGNARMTNDIERAIVSSHPDWIVICVGNGENLAKNDIRAANATATTTALRNNPNCKNTRVLVVSSTGAGTSKIVVGFGIGWLISFHLRHVLADHTRQEEVFLEQLGADRVTVVRATALTDDAATGQLKAFGDNDRGPSIKTDRADLTTWIAKEICEVGEKGRIVNVTSVKKVSK